MNTHKKLILKARSICLVLIILGIICIAGGAIVYRVEKSFQTELLSGKYSIHKLHSLLYIQSAEDLVSTEKDIYTAAMKYRALSIMFNAHIIGGSKSLIWVGITMTSAGIYLFTNNVKMQNQWLDPTRYGGN